MNKSLMNFKGFKKVSDDKDQAVMAHPDGHQVHLVKKLLSPALQKQLAALPLHQSEPTSEVIGADSPDMPDQPQSNILGQANPAAPKPIGPTMGTEQGENAGMVPPPEFPQQSPSQAMPPEGSPYDEAPGYKEATAAQQTMGAAYGTAGRTEAEAYTKAAKADQDALLAVQGDLKSKGDEIKAATQDIRDAHINPNSYLESMDAGKKVTTAIGLLLGGISSGMTGQPNPALTFLHNQIDRDLNAQKANMEQKNNLLVGLERQYGDKIVAENMFKAIRANTLSNQVGAAGAKLNSALGQQNAQLGQATLKQQAADYLRKAHLAQMQANVNGSSGDMGEMDKNSQAYLTSARLFDPKGAEEFEKRYVPNVGVAAVPLEAKDRELLQKKTELHDLLDRAGSFLEKSGPLGNWSLGTKATGTQLHNEINLKMGELSDLTRFTPEENKIYQQSVPDFNSTHFTDKDKNLLRGLNNSNENSLHTIMRQKGIPFKDAVTVLDPQGRSGTIPRSQLDKAKSMGYKEVQ